MAQRLFKVTKEFSAHIPDQIEKKQLIKIGDGLWADPDQMGSTTIFRIDNLEFEVDSTTFRSSTQLKQ